VARVVIGSPPSAPEPIRSPADFRRILREGRRIRKAGLTVVIAESPYDYSRLGLVVSRRVGSAVVRNRIKRRIRSAAREAGLPASDYVVIPTAEVATMPYSALVSGLKESSVS